MDFCLRTVINCLLCTLCERADRWLVSGSVSASVNVTCLVYTGAFDSSYRR